MGSPKIKELPPAPPPPEPPPEVVNPEMQEDSRKRRATGTKSLQINKNSMAIPK